MYGTLVELAQSATFHTLTEAVNNEKGKKAALQEMILKYVFILGSVSFPSDSVKHSNLSITHRVAFIVVLL